MRVILSVLLFLTGCAGHGLHCDGQLSPINRPATVKAAATASAVPSVAAP